MFIDTLWKDQKTWKWAAMFKKKKKKSAVLIKEESIILNSPHGIFGP